jgi:hypothetical protein
MALKNPLAWKEKTEEKQREQPRHTSTKTKLTIKYDCGFPNIITIRGSGAPQLSWEKGVPLKNVKPDEWVFETDASFGKCEFKVLINDTIYESGSNHTLMCGAQSQYTPHF